MDENPYSPPHRSPSSLQGLSEVKVRSRFPLEIIAQRTISLDVSEEVLNRRVHQLTEACGFVIADQGKRKWTLQRGSLWHALYTFSVRKLPTTVVLDKISDTQLSIWLRCHSAITVSTPGDAKLIARELDEMETRLVNAG